MCANVNWSDNDGVILGMGSIDIRRRPSFKNKDKNKEVGKQAPAESHGRKDIPKTSHSDL